jgi:hypothetical protein
MPRQYTQVQTARARDLAESDVIRVDGKWHLILNIHTSMEDVEKYYSTEYLRNTYTEMGKAAKEAFEDHWDGDYLVIRYIDHSRSHGDTVEDVVRVFFGWDLIAVQDQPAFQPNSKRRQQGEKP